MAYASAEDLAARLGSSKFQAIYRDSPNAPAEDIADAAAEIDGYLAKRYLVPVTAPDALALLRTWTLDLAIERAFLRPGGSEIPEKYKKRAADVRQNLRDVAKGTMVLPADAAESGRSAGGSVLVVGNEPEFTREKMAGY
jgi:phage gp36-like protein